MQKGARKILYYPAWINVLINTDTLDSKTDLNRKVNLAYSHMNNICKKLKDNGYLHIEKKGRINIITLTKKGRELQKILIQARNLIDYGEFPKDNGI